MFICEQPCNEKVENMLRKKKKFPVMMSLSVIYVKILHVVTSCQKKKSCWSLTLYTSTGDRNQTFMIYVQVYCVLESIPVCVLFCSPGPIVHVSFSDLLSSVVHVCLYFFCSLFHRRDGVNFSLNLVQQSLDNVGWRKDLNFLLQNQEAS